MKFPVVALAEDKFQVSVDINLYAKEVLTAAIYKFSHLFYIHQQTDVDNQMFMIFYVDIILCYRLFLLKT